MGGERRLDDGRKEDANFSSRDDGQRRSGTLVPDTSTRSRIAV
jgi:hypothetical protein